MIRRSTLLTEEIGRTAEITGIMVSSHQIRRRRDHSDAPMMQRSGVRFIIPQDMIWKSVKLFWIVRRCRYQQRQHLKIPIRVNITEKIPMAMSIWQRSTWSSEAASQSPPRHKGRSYNVSEINLAQWIEPGRRMRWSNVDISFGPEDHPDTELPERNLSLIIKIPIGRHLMAKTLIDNKASLNLMMRKAFIELDLNLADLTPVHDTFHGIILG
jgi:hypothetical protein